MICVKWFSCLLVVMVVGSSASADELINPTTNNGSFELADGVANTSKIGNWDGDGTADIDNWVLWAGTSTADGDSGVEQNTGTASDGVMIGFMQGGNAVHNMTAWVGAENDSFYFSWDHVNREGSGHSVSLVYDDGGIITPIAASEVFSSGTLETLSGTFVIPAGSPAIGNAIGLGVIATGSYPEIDNFILEVNEDLPVLGDVNDDGVVDLDDYAVIRDNFRLSPATPLEGDIAGSDIVDLEDFLFWRSEFSASSSSEGLAVPEPATWLLAAIGLAAVGTRKLNR